MENPIVKQKGFSLIEMIVVVSIIAIVSGIFVPTYISLRPKFRLNGAVRQIQGDLMWARMQAVRQNNRFRIIFVNNHQYQILDDDDSDNTADDGESIIKKDIQTNYNDVTFNPTPTQNPIFEPRGMLHWPIGITINLINPSGTKAVIVNTTGRIRVE